MSVISYKYSSFEEHKMLSLLGILIAIKAGIYYINLLHNFIIQLYYANFRLHFCHLVFSSPPLPPQMLWTILNWQKKS